ncbi:hypothetical protein CNR27_03330 [Luteimonas chenhongjianii]|uniref:S1/P1 Nuclease n=1 Tax=Luteimonas chenhongjianii TaxID=2006110 RepID=A0A290XBS1_9GAMM|nr:S1/P1 nuclease [Luteimonas chenhongjianii]ATD66602.1 hypothetical protein CNR27_03330 [Luteimonas chenhongjianii]
MNKIRLTPRLQLATLLCVLAAPAAAWTEPGHAVIAEIAYDILQREDPQRLDEIVAAIDKHPDQASFRVAVNGASGEERQRRLLSQCSRWAMDAAGSVFDHPTWHVGGRDLSREHDYAVDADNRFGNATQAFTLNLATWQDSTATAAERALSLCWVMHIVGDVHAPTHVAQEVSSTFPQGDRWGTRQFVRDQPDATAVGLHRYWDFAISKDSDPDAARRVAAQIAATFAGKIGRPDDETDIDAAFSTWVDETFALAQSAAYGPDLVTGTTADSAPVLPESYRDRTRAASARQAALAGSRLAWILMRDR